MTEQLVEYYPVGWNLLLFREPFAVVFRKWQAWLCNEWLHVAGPML